MPREIAIVVFPGFQLLDAAGPVAVFEMAERFRPGNYAISVLAPDGGAVRSSSGVSLAAMPLERRRFDTVIETGSGSLTGCWGGELGHELQACLCGLISLAICGGVRAWR